MEKSFLNKETLYLIGSQCGAENKVKTNQCPIFGGITEFAENCKLDHFEQERIRDTFIFNIKKCGVHR